MQSMRKAFVLVNTNLGSEAEVESELKKIEGKDTLIKLPRGAK